MVWKIVCLVIFQRTSSERVDFCEPFRPFHFSFLSDIHSEGWYICSDRGSEISSLSTPFWRIQVRGSTRSISFSIHLKIALLNAHMLMQSSHIRCPFRSPDESLGRPDPLHPSSTSVPLAPPLALKEEQALTLSPTFHYSATPQLTRPHSIAKNRESKSERETDRGTSKSTHNTPVPNEQGPRETGQP